MSTVRNLRRLEDDAQADTIRSLKESTHMALVQTCGGGEFHDQMQRRDRMTLGDVSGI
jgi:hypothetical protein